MRGKIYDPLWKRALLSLPFVAVSMWPWVEAEASAALTVPYLLKMVEDGFWKSSSGAITLSMDDPHLHIPWLDKAINPLLAVFTPSMTGIDPLGRLQMIAFLADTGPLFAVGMLEKFRRHHHWSSVLYSILFVVAAQIIGIGILAGAYFLIEYLWSPTLKFSTAESALMPRSAVNSLLVAMLLVYYPLLVASYSAPTTERRIQFNAVWQLFPILVVIAQGAMFPFFSRLVSKSSAAQPPNANANAKAQAQADMHSVRLAMGALSILSAIAFFYVRFTRPQGISMLEIFFPLDYGAPIDSFETTVRRMLQWDHICWIAPGYYWLLLSFRDLQLRGVDVSWARVVLGLVLGTINLGAGATFGLVWLWRERLVAESFGSDPVKRD